MIINKNPAGKGISMIENESVKYRVGIICPVSREYEACKKRLALGEETVYNKKKIARAFKNGIFITAVLAGFGKINCACAAGWLAGDLKCDILIDSGSAGALDGCCGIGDIVFSADVYEYDMLPVEKFKKFKSELSSATSLAALIEIEGSADIFAGYVKLAEAASGRAVFTGNCACGEKDVNSTKLKETLKNSYGCMICDWESSAVVKTANLRSVDCFSIRSVSDHADENMMKDYRANADGSLDKLYEAVAIFIYGGWMQKLFDRKNSFFSI